MENPGEQQRTYYFGKILNSWFRISTLDQIRAEEMEKEVKRVNIFLLTWLMI